MPVKDYNDRTERTEQNENRPLSRRGTNATEVFLSGERNSAMVGRVAASGGQGITRPPPTGVPSARKSTSRLLSGTAQFPKTGQPVFGVSNINVLDRPITQQGVSGVRTAGIRGPQFRQVLDKRYYEGLIRMKIKDINVEMGRLNGEIESETQQQAASQIYEKRVREIASELTMLQGQLIDYNVVIDKVNTSMDKSHIDSEAEQLKLENERRREDLEELYGECRLKEEQISRLESEIQKEKDVTEKLINEMSDSDKHKYETLKNANENLLKEIDQCQQQLDVLTNQKMEFEERLSGSQLKLETVRLYHKLREREERRESLLENEKTRSTPAQEREKLLQRVKEDNTEMAAIDRQINEINEEIKKKRDELEMTEQDLDECQSDRHHKFKELKKREETLDRFLSTFEESKHNETVKIGESETKIVSALQQMSHKLIKGRSKLPGRDEFDEIKESLISKEEEVKKSAWTVSELDVKKDKLSANLKKVDELEKKIQDEMVDIQEKATFMTEQLKSYSDVDTLKSKANENQVQLTSEKQDLIKKKESLRKQKSELTRENDLLTKDLKENETYIQLNSLEKKLELLVQNNDSMREFNNSKKAEMELEPLKTEALNHVHEYNRMLIASHSK